MARLLSLDIGQKRTGVAVSDPQQIIAGSLTVIPTAQLYDFLLQYIQKEPVERIIVGLPLQTTGAPSTNYQRVITFAQHWQQYQTIPLTFYDERYTSVIAQQLIRETNPPRKIKHNKQLVDAISATLILQDYMKQHHT